MNTIVAFIQPFQLERVVDALRSLRRFPGMSVSEVRGFGRLLAHPPRPGERTEVDPFQPKLRLEIACLKADVPAIAETIRQAARTGHAGDGIVLVADLAWVYQIRSVQLGQDGLSPRQDSDSGE
jgi:nitrogen regulatory protein PII